MSVSMSFHADADTRTDLHDYGTNRAPILSLRDLESVLTITALDSVPLADHLAFARRFADDAAGYLSALERFAAAQTADSTEVA